MFKGVVLVDDIELFSCTDRKEEVVSKKIAENVPDRLVFACRTVITEVCDKCGKSIEETGECPDKCPEQEFCANLCGNHHDINDKSTGWNDNGNEPWFCDECKDEQIKAIASRQRHDAWLDKQNKGW